MKTYREVPITERLPEIENENYLTVTEKGIKRSRFFNGKRFETAYYEGEVTHWLEEYRSQLTESKELPGKEELTSKLIQVSSVEQTRGGVKTTTYFADIVDLFYSIASPLLASKDARIRELELNRLPEGWKVYKCTDCQEINVKKDNKEIRVGFCDKCEHPLWND